jgi:hypothetical protein
MNVLKRLCLKMADLYLQVPLALYRGLGSFEDIERDYQSKIRALSLLGMAHVANIILLLVVGRPAWWRRVVQHRNQTLLVAAAVSLPWGLWLNEKIDEKKKGNSEPLALARQLRSYAMVVAYVIVSIVTLVIGFWIDYSRRRGAV